MPYIFGKQWHLAITWAVRKAFQCILQGVRFLMANHTLLSPTSDNESYTVIYSGLHSRPTRGNPNTISGISIEIGLTACAPLLFYKGCPQTNLAWKEIIEIMQSDYEPRFSFLSCSCRLAADEVLNWNGFLIPLHQLLASSEDLSPSLSLKY